MYGKVNGEPVIETLSFDKKDDIGNSLDKEIIYGFDYSPCQFNLTDTIYVKLVGVEGKFNYTLTMYYDVQDNYKIICMKGTSPPNLIYPAVVNNKYDTISFGGKIKDSFDDNIYLLSTDLKWKRIPRGEKQGPSGRYGHFMSSYDGKLIVFGGKDKDERSLNDLWVYDLANENWTEIVYNNIITNVPKPKFLTTGVLIKRYGVILFFGGKNSEDNSIYLLNLNILFEILLLKKENKYSLDHIESVAKLNKLWTIKSDMSNRRIYIDIISRYGHTITKISDNEVMIYGGFDASDNAISNCEIINLDTFSVTNIYQDNQIRPNSRGFHNILPIGPILILYGGKLGNKENMNDVWKFVISQRKWIKLTEMNEFYLFRSGFIFSRLYGSERPVIYGGENRNRETVSDFIQLTFPICTSETYILNENNCFPCAEGYILTSQQKCQECGIGLFADYRDKYVNSECNLCPKGTYNDDKGSFRESSCDICKIRTFNDESGKSSCNPCKDNQLCLPSKTCVI